eukprot:670130-Lingulodinium_polyedra.AAC.1
MAMVSVLGGQTFATRRAASHAVRSFDNCVSQARAFFITMVGQTSPFKMTGVTRRYCTSV